MKGRYAPTAPFARSGNARAPGRRASAESAVTAAPAICCSLPTDPRGICERCGKAVCEECRARGEVRVEGRLPTLCYPCGVIVRRRSAEGLRVHPFRCAPAEAPAPGGWRPGRVIRVEGDDAVAEVEGEHWTLAGMATLVAVGQQVTVRYDEKLDAVVIRDLPSAEIS